MSRSQRTSSRPVPEKVGRRARLGPTGGPAATREAGVEGLTARPFLLAPNLGRGSLAAVRTLRGVSSGPRAASGIDAPR